MKFEFIENPTANDIQTIRNGLVAYNEPYFQGLDENEFIYFFRGEREDIQGGMTGSLFNKALFVRFFWISEKVRGKGLGKELMQNLESDMRARGVKTICLDTYTFQAPKFYQDAGFKEVGRYIDYPQPGVDKIFYQKFIA